MYGKKKLGRESKRSDRSNSNALCIIPIILSSSQNVFYTRPLECDDQCLRIAYLCSLKVLKYNHEISRVIYMVLVSAQEPYR